MKKKSLIRECNVFRAWYQLIASFRVGGDTKQLSAVSSERLQAGEKEIQTFFKVLLLVRKASDEKLQILPCKPTLEGLCLAAWCGNRACVGGFSAPGLTRNTQLPGWS